MRIHFLTNCQGWGIQWMFRQSPDAHKFTTECVQNFRVLTGEETREWEAEVVQTADILFYHATNRVFPWPETVTPKPECRLIPLSVFYQGAYFLMENARPEVWQPIIDMARDRGVDEAVRALVEDYDLSYRHRWRDDLEHMQRKEEEEGVNPEHRISLWQHEGSEFQQVLTKNHPSSLLFLRWANLLLESLGFRPLRGNWIERCRANPNIVNLPCEDWVTTATRKHLGLKWGGTEYENVRSREYAREKLTGFLK